MPLPLAARIGLSDGPRYRGRGPIQITGLVHDAEVSRWAFDNGYVQNPTYFVDNSERLADTQYGFLGAVWYWTVRRPDTFPSGEAA